MNYKFKLLKTNLKSKKREFVGYKKLCKYQQAIMYSLDNDEWSLTPIPHEYELLSTGHFDCNDKEIFDDDRVKYYGLKIQFTVKFGEHNDYHGWYLECVKNKKYRKAFQYPDTLEIIEPSEEK